jgi:hypothetical protein
VYILCDRSNPGIYKVGSSENERTMEVRTKELKRKCKVEVWRVDRSVGLTRHFKRLEDLLHAELEPYKHVPECYCRIKHREWFKGDLDIAKAVLRRWEGFVRQEPWKGDQGLTTFWERRLYDLISEFDTEGQDQAQSRGGLWDRFVSQPSAVDYGHYIRWWRSYKRRGTMALAPKS